MMNSQFNSASLKSLNWPQIQPLTLWIESLLISTHLYEHLSTRCIPRFLNSSKVPSHLSVSTPWSKRGFENASAAILFQCCYLQFPKRMRQSEAPWDAICSHAPETFSYSERRGFIYINVSLSIGIHGSCGFVFLGA